MTIFRKYHEELLTIISDCLFNNTLVYYVTAHTQVYAGEDFTPSTTNITCELV